MPVGTSEWKPLRFSPMFRTETTHNDPPFGFLARENSHGRFASTSCEPPACEWCRRFHARLAHTSCEYRP
eukprot:3551525-Amphidinium_carterae.1